MFYVYKYQNKINNKVYIGKTNNPYKRNIAHNYDALVGGSLSCFHAAIRKYGIDNFDFIILDEFELEEESFNAEKVYIAQYKSNVNTYSDGYGYNLTDGGRGGSSGAIVSEETRIKISNARMGHRHSNETKKKLSNQKLGNKNPRYGKPPLNLGISPSEDVRMKMSESQTGLHIGENNRQAKLNESDVLNIKEMISEGMRNKDIAPLFNVDKTMISKIRLNKNWTHLKLKKE